MPRKLIAAKRCYFCNDCVSDSANNIRNHCRRFHTDIDDLIGKAPSGFTFRRLDEEDNANILVAIKREGNKNNVMYCLTCNLTQVCNKVEPSDASSFFATHDCEEHKRPPSKLKGRILGPRKKEAMPTTTAAPAPVRTDGMWLDEALYNSLRAKYPAVGILDPFKDGKEGQVFDATTFLNAIGKEVTEAEKYQKAYRQSQTAAPTPTIAVSSDAWESVVKELLGDKDLGDRMDELYEAEKESYQADYKDYFNIKDEDDDDDEDEEDNTIEHVTDEEPPDANIYRRAIKTALLHSTKIGSISTMAKKQAAAEVAKKQREIDDITKELVDLRREVATLRSRS
jgi:hypothetical protein